MGSTNKEQEIDYCVNCGAETKYKKTDHIDHRTGYIEGAGQLCTRCFYNHRFIK